MKLLNLLFKSKMAKTTFFMSKILLMLLVFSIGTQYVSAKNTLNDKENVQQTVTGVITDSDGVPLPGATILEKGTTNGTQSDFDGKFSLNVPSNATLVISYVGFATQEIQVNNQTNFNIQLVTEASSLEEVVLVGYGTKKITSVTTEVSAVDIEELGNITTQNIATALQGRVPGLFIRDAGYNKGLSVLVRGATTIGNNNPLYVIDGIPQDLLTVEPNDIEAVSVLKGGAASAIYGARAAAGVILVTTKTGKNKKAAFNFESFVSWGDLTTVQKAANSLDSAEIMNEASINSNGNPAFTAADLAKFTDGIYDPNYASTDWKKETLKTEITQRYFLSATGGNENSSYYFSLGYRNADGIMKMGIDNKQYTLRSNLKTKLRDNIELGVNLSYNLSNNTSPSLNIDAIYNHLNVIAPWAGVRESEDPGAKYNHFAYSGTYARGFWNPLWELEAGTQNNKSKTFTANTNLTWEIIDGLKLIGRYALISNTARGVSRTYKGSTTGAAPWVSDVNSLSQTWRDNNQYNAQTLVTYDKSFDKHNLSVLAGWEVQFNKDSYISAGRRNFNYDFLLSEFNAPNSGDNDDITGLSSNTGESALQSGFGRIDYNFDEKYFLELSARYDGSNIFAPENRYGFFPSVSAAWVISKEDFFNSNTIDRLKLRASVGKIGNNRVSGSYFATVGFGSYRFGNGGDIAVPTAAEGSVPFRDLTWETTTTTNFGVDFSINKGIIGGSLDVYSKKTDDILLGSPVPGAVGTYTSGPPINAGSVKNNGVELVLTHDNTLSNGLRYGIAFNATYNKNEITELTDAFTEFSTSYRVGDALGTVYGYESTGLLKSQAEADAYKAAITSGISGATGPGDIAYVDQNGDGKLDFEDRVAIAETIPKITYGINFNADWKNFDFQMFFQGTGKSKEHKINDLFGNYSWIPEEASDAWSANNTDGTYPRLFLYGNQTYFQNFGTNSSFWTFKSNYLRLKNLQLGYTLPIKENSYFNKVRIYFAGTNLLTVSDFRPGFDPESQSLDIPPLKTFSLGVNINF